MNTMFSLIGSTNIGSTKAGQAGLINDEAYRAIRPHVPLYIEKDRFLLKTVSNVEELRESLKLRHDTFFVEYKGEFNPSGLDMDEFDLICDHLIVIDKQEVSSMKVVGTYRMISSTFSKRFYSQTEFNIDGFLALSGEKLELGRACIDQDYRNGAVINLLWRGVMEYARKTNSSYLFGCSSVKTTNPLEAALIAHLIFRDVPLPTDFNIKPLEAYVMPGFNEIMPQDLSTVPPYMIAEVKRKLPSLLKTYLRAAATICKEPALDREFECIDFFTILCIDQMNLAFERRYSKV